MNDIKEVPNQGFSSLQIAIQKKDLNTIRKFHKIAPVFNLSAYDLAVIDELIHNNLTKMNKLPLPSHNELITCFQALYAIDPDIVDKGICFGIAHMDKQAFFCEETDLFIKRLKNIKSNVWPIVNEAINAVKGEGISFSKNKKEFFEQVRRKLEDKFPYPIWHDIYAFFDGIILSFAPSKFPNYFDPKQRLTQQALPAELLIEPVLYAKKKIILVQQKPLLGVYNKNNLATYFQCLEKALEHFNQPISFEISTGAHAFNIRYVNKKWVFADANDLGYIEKELDAKKIAQLLIKHYDAPSIFTARPFITKESEPEFTKCLAFLQSDPNWIKLHELNKKQFLCKNKHGYNLLQLAVKEKSFEIFARGMKIVGPEEAIKQKKFRR